MKVIMPSSQPVLPDKDQALLADFGMRLRLARKRRKLSQVAVADSAGIARATLQRAELGAPAVALGTYLRILHVLGLQQDVNRLAESDPLAPGLPDEPLPARRRPAWVTRPSTAHRTDRIRVRDFPQLKQLAWQLGDDAELAPAEALGLYERNWRYVDPSGLGAAERRLIERLKKQHGRGVMLV